MDGSKWIATVASIWIQCTCGSSYAFGIYSSVLKSTQSYSQSTLDTVSVFKDIGANAGVISGLLYSAVAVKRGTSSGTTFCYRFGGPWVVHVAGAIQCFVGYFLMWLSVEGVIDQPPVEAMCLFMFLAAHAQTFFNTANVVTAVQNFPEYSGTIVGIMKGYLGLSGAVLVQIYYTFCNGNPSTFILILALLPSLTTFLLMFLVKASETSAKDDIRHLNGFSALSVAVAIYIMIIIILENTITIPTWGRTVSFALLLLLVISPLVVAITAQREASRTPSIDNNLVDDSQLLVSEHIMDSPTGSVKDHQDRMSLLNGEDLNLVQAMSTLNFWLLSVAMACGMGSGLATINNISQIGESLGYTTVERSNLVSLWSIWNFTGRFGAGYVSDYLLHTRNWPRPSIMIITLATMSVGHLIIASGFTGNLYVGSVIIGICYGSQWSLMPTITSEIFGVGHMGTIFNTIAVASPLGSYILSVRVVGYFYDKEASGSKVCLGSHCFMMSFLIMAFVMLFASLVSVVLFYRTRRFYRMLMTRRVKRLA